MPSKGIPPFARAVPSLLLRAVALILAALACAAASGAARAPMSGGGAVVLEPVPPRESPRTWRRLVFTCTTPGLVIFSDRPCGPLPALHELKLTAPVAAPPGANPNVTPPAPVASPHAASAVRERDDVHAPDVGARRAEACRRLADAVQALDARMRAGYSAREAARLWQRWRDMKNRLRTERC